MDRRNLTFSLAIMALMITSTLPVDAQGDPIQNAGKAHTGLDAAPGNTVRIAEKVPFYLDMNTAPTGSGHHAGYQHFARPANNEAVASLQLTNIPTVAERTAVFHLPTGAGLFNTPTGPDLRAKSGNVLQAIEVFEVGATWYASCAVEGTALDGIAMSVDIDAVDDQGVKTADIANGNADGNTLVLNNAEVDGVQEFKFTATKGDPASGGGWNIPAGHYLRATFGVNTLNAQCTMQVGGDSNGEAAGVSASRLTVLADTARINTWIDDFNGKPTSSLPSVASASPERRKFAVDVLYQSEWQVATNYLGANQLKAVTDTMDVRLKIPGGDVKYDNKAPDTNVLKRTTARSTSAVAAGVNLISFGFQTVAGASALADGNYVVEAYGPGFAVPTPTFGIGQKSLTFLPVDGKLIHEVNPGERTEFRLVVHNKGTAVDTVGVTQTAASNGWKADLVNSRVTVQPGGKAEIVYLISPPTGAVDGAQGKFTLRPTSSYADTKFFNAAGTDVTSNPNLELTVDVTNTEKIGATLTGSIPTFEMSPGETVQIPGLRLVNDGTAEGSFVLSVGFPNNIQGWNGKVAPSGATIPPGGSRDFAAEIKAPTNAADGTEFTATIKANRLGSSQVVASVNVPIKIEIAPAIEITTVSNRDAVAKAAAGEAAVAAAATLSGRVKAGDNDNDWDNSVMFRLEMKNPKLLSETYDLTFTEGTPQCFQRTGDAARPGWSYEFGTASAITGGVGKFGEQKAQVTIGPGATMYYYVHMHDSKGATASCDATLNVKATSTTDRSVEATFSLNAKRGADAFEFHIEPAPGTGTERFQKIAKGAPKDGSTYAQVTYDFRVMHFGDEKKDLIIEVPQAQSGWTHSLSVRGDGTIPAGEPDCQNLNGNTRRMSCTNIGPGDEILMRLTVQADSSLPLGRQLISNVQVRATDNNQITGEQSFTTTTVGRFDFDAFGTKANRKASPGSTVTLPFVIDNRGTEGDNFRLTLTAGSSDWRPRFSSDQSFFLAGQTKQVGYLLVRVPDGAAVGITESFRVEVSSDNAQGTKFIDASVQVRAAYGIQMGYRESGSVPLTNSIEVARGVSTIVDIDVISPSSRNGENIQFFLDKSALPAGWSATYVIDGNAVESRQTTLAAGDTADPVQLRITPPNDALGTSKVPILLRADCSKDGATATECAAVDMIATLGSDAAVSTTYNGESPVAILAGGQARLVFDVRNDGLNLATFNIEAQNLPNGWAASFSPPQLNLDPLETAGVEALIQAPADANPGALVEFNVLVSSSDAFAVQPLSAMVGFNDILVTGASNTIKVAPTEKAVFVYTLENTGTLPDEVRVTAGIADAGLADDATVKVSQDLVKLGLNEAKQITVEVDIGPNAPVANIATDVTFSSLQEDGAEVTRKAIASVLNYVANDVDGDRIKEYAVDRNGNRGDGFEEFLQAPESGGVHSAPADLMRFLSKAGRDAKVVQENGQNVVKYVIDGDKDGKVDHFIDSNRDGLPDAYWDPDRGTGHVHAITTFKDVNADGIADYFVDVDGDGRIDRVFDVVLGKFTNVLVRDIDGDGTLDYAVDANGNGEIDPSETVLFTRGGTLLTVLKVDVDGDGKLDDVFDTDGDGKVDSFIRAGESDARNIRLRDVNGDGVLDWTYDSNLDGRMDSYYDPATGQGGQKIDTASNFGQLVADYWFIPAIFLLVIVLFIVLIAVTRR